MQLLEDLLPGLYLYQKEVAGSASACRASCAALVTFFTSQPALVLIYYLYSLR